MKLFAALAGVIAAPFRRWNVRIVVWMLLGLVVMVTAYSAVFHHLMATEGVDVSWATSVYWTLTTMSTLGYGDLTFTSDAGRLFSLVVLISGALYILVVLPFAFIQFVFAPWMDDREAARVPRRVPDGLRDHIVITRLDSVTQALIARAKRSRIPHVVLVAEPKDAVRLQDEGYRAMVGPLDAPSTYRAAGVDRAALVVSTQADTTNTNVAFTVREINDDVPIVATADSPASVDVLELAGCDRVVELASLLGMAMARRVIGTAGRAHVVGEFGSIRIVEAGVGGTMVGQTLDELAIRERSGLLPLALYEDGRLRPPTPTASVAERTILVLAGSDVQVAAYDRAFSSVRTSERPVLILGGGRVGRAAASALAADGVPHRIVEQRRDRAAGPHTVHGNAAELEVLRKAGLDDAAAVLVTTHEDDMNVYLTLYCRRLRPDLQVLARAVHERNVTTLQRAGADSVLSYAALGATAIWNILDVSHRVVLAEGIELFVVPVPPRLTGRALHDPEVVAETGCHVVAAVDADETLVIPSTFVTIGRGSKLIVMGSRHSERRFRQRYLSGD